MNIEDLEKEKNEGIARLPLQERHKFLKRGLDVTGVFLGGTVLSLTSVSHADTQSDPEMDIPKEGQYPYPKHYGMVMRQNRYVDCEKCVDACKQTNHVPNDHGAWRTAIQERITTENGAEKREFRPVLCNHCNRAPPTSGSARPRQSIKILKQVLW